MTKIRDPDVGADNQQQHQLVDGARFPAAPGDPGSDISDTVVDAVHQINLSSTTSSDAAADLCVTSGTNGRSNRDHDDDHDDEEDVRRHPRQKDMKSYEGTAASTTPDRQDSDLRITNPESESNGSTVSCLLSRESISSSSSLSVGSSVTTTSSLFSAASSDSGSSSLLTIAGCSTTTGSGNNTITSTSEPDHCSSPSSMTMTSLNGSSVAAGGASANTGTGCKPFRSFKSSDEYLIAMKEDLAEWLNQLYDLDISVENFISSLETGVILCRHANTVIQKAVQLAGSGVPVPEYFLSPKSTSSVTKGSKNFMKSSHSFTGSPGPLVTSGRRSLGSIHTPATAARFNLLFANRQMDEEENDGETPSYTSNDFRSVRTTTTSNVSDDSKRNNNSNRNDLSEMTGKGWNQSGRRFSSAFSDANQTDRQEERGHMSLNDVPVRRSQEEGDEVTSDSSIRFQRQESLKFSHESVVKRQNSSNNSSHHMIPNDTISRNIRNNVSNCNINKMGIGTTSGSASVNNLNSKNINYTISCRANAVAGSFHARDNVCNFITWCRSLGIRECLLFETEDLVLGKNEKSFILCLLEVARKGSLLGLQIPMLVQLEQEIDQQIQEESYDEVDGDQEDQKEVSQTAPNNNNSHTPVTRIPVLKSSSNLRIRSDSSSDCRSTEATEDSITSETQHDSQYNSETDSDSSSNFASMQPQVQIVTNDLKSLHEHVVELLNRCTCPSQYPMIKVADGKYRIGDTKTLIFVRILRRHVMVRVGGGWDTLEHYLDKHDPCRCYYMGGSSSSSNISGSGPGVRRRSSVTSTTPLLNNSNSFRNGVRV